jgi:hypothetical protein
MGISILLYYRHEKAKLLHAEQMAAIERGVSLPVPQSLPRPIDPIRRYLLSGMTWLFSGIGLALFLFALSATLPNTEAVSQGELQNRIETLRKLGAQDRELREVVYESERRSPRMPIGFGVIGLIPIGVGLAHLIFYAGERKHQPPVQ